MKRAVSRAIGCAHILLLGLALLIAVAHPAMAQQATSPAPAKPAAKPVAAKPAAKPAARRWGHTYSRWNRYSRWGHRAYTWKKPVAWAKPGAKPAVAIASKWAAKPAAKPAVKAATSTASTSAAPAKAAPAKPAAYAKPVAKSAWAKPAAKSNAWVKPAAAAKPAAWAKPAAKAAAKPAAWAKPAAAKPTPAKPAIKPVKPASAHTVAKPQAAPVNLTRDANNGSATGTAVTTLAGAGQLDVAKVSMQMAGSLAIVLVLVVAFVFFLRRYYKGAPVGEAGTARGLMQPASSAPAGNSSLLFGLISGQRGKPIQAPATPGVGAEALSAIGPGGLQILGAQTLPGSGTLIYLVRIEDHIVLLGASYAGGVRLLAEWENEAEAETETSEEKSKFESYLREQGLATEAQREEEEHTFATIRARLNSTADRLAGLRAEFGG